MFVVISIMYCGNDMATRGFIVDVLCIIQVIEITQTILPLRKCYGFKNRGRVGIVNNIPQTLENKGFGGFLFVREYFLSTFVQLSDYNFSIHCCSCNSKVVIFSSNKSMSF